MGFFSEIASEACRSVRTGAPPQPAVPEPSQEAPPIPGPAPVQAKPGPTPAAPDPVPATPMPDPAPAAPTTPAPPPELKLDTAQGAAPAPDDTAARQKHEAAEAKRKAEWEAKQAEKKAARQAALDRIAAMNRAELLAESIKRVAKHTFVLRIRHVVVGSVLCGVGEVDGGVPDFQQAQSIFDGRYGFCSVQALEVGVGDALALFEVKKQLHIYKSPFC